MKKSGNASLFHATRQTRFSYIVGWGMALPEKVLTNSDLARLVDTSDEWITERTGIRERRVATEQETTSTFAIRAARQALETARIIPSKVDMVIVATTTPDQACPSTACIVQEALGAYHAGAFDLAAACTGFIYALEMASRAICAGSIQTAIVIGADTLSKVVDWKDRSTCILFGDGAGAVVLQGSDTPGGVLRSILRSDGSGGSHLSIPGGTSGRPTAEKTVDTRYLQMNGREIFRFATRTIASIAKELLHQTGLTIAEIDLVIPHQANERIIEAAAKAMNLPKERFLINLGKYGNTSAASIPIALNEAVRAGKIEPGHLLFLVGFGGGLTWGATIVEWNAKLPPPPTTVQRWQYSWQMQIESWRVTAKRVLRGVDTRIRRYL